MRQSFIGSTVAIVIAGALIFTGVHQFPYGIDSLFGGITATAGILAYRSAKKRRLGLKPDSAARRRVEKGLLVLTCLPPLLFGVGGVNAIATNPTSRIVVPIWSLIAFIWVTDPEEHQGLRRHAVDSIAVGPFLSFSWYHRRGHPSKYYLHYASYLDSLLLVPGKSKTRHRSGCPVSLSLETFGDRWSLLIIRDLMVRGYRTFKEFEQSGERIATNILADRLRKLQAGGIITTEADPADGRKLNYRLTEKGIDLAPVLLELLIWGAQHEETGAPYAVIDEMAKNRKAVLTEVRRRWQDRDPRPFLPRFRRNDGGQS
jgi:DNA-binding HxlR family transcriptional regulator